MIRHILKSQQFTLDFLDALFKRADYLREHSEDTLKGSLIATLFYEPSTRTRLSFESAMIRLGGGVVGTEDATSFSSVSKGESLIDTIRVLSHYVDGIVLRHNREGASEIASSVSSVPIINAGDGKGQHPTQTLLDVYTIKRELGCIDGITIGIVGDLKHGRTVRSLCYLLGKYKDITVYFVSPKQLCIGEDIKDYLDRHHVSYSEGDSLQDVIPKVDVVYMTRIQKERMSEEIYNASKGSFVIDDSTLSLLKKDAIIMHPLPHLEEISLDKETETNDSRVAYFRQAENGLYIRMALLEYVLKKGHIYNSSPR